jgi:hypothetical protein
VASPGRRRRPTTQFTRRRRLVHEILDRLSKRAPGVRRTGESGFAPGPSESEEIAMTATVVNHSRTIPTAKTSTRPALWRTGLAAAALASVAAEAFTAVLRAAGVHLAVGSIGGTAADVVDIGAGACTIMIAICVAAGLVVAAALNRWARRPQRSWRVVACALTAASFVPDVFAGATATSSKVSLMAAHVIAASIVIPLVGRSLRSGR